MLQRSICSSFILFNVEWNWIHGTERESVCVKVLKSHPHVTTTDKEGDKNMSVPVDFHNTAVNIAESSESFSYTTWNDSVSPAHLCTMFRLSLMFSAVLPGADATVQDQWVVHQELPFWYTVYIYKYILFFGGGHCSQFFLLKYYWIKVNVCFALWTAFIL